MWLGSALHHSGSKASAIAVGSMDISVITVWFPYQAGAGGDFTGGGGGGTAGAFWSQGQITNLDGVNAWPGWYDGGGVVVPPFGGDASGGSGQLYNVSGAEVLTGGGAGGQQHSSSGQGGVVDSDASFGTSGGTPPFSGGNDGVNVSDRDGLGTSRPAMAGQQLDGDEGYDERGLLGTFGDFPHEPLEDDGFLTVGPALHVLPVQPPPPCTVVGVQASCCWSRLVGWGQWRFGPWHGQQGAHVQHSRSGC